MAKDTTSKAGSKPAISSHPLFPATVGLWFGALFGLGSLAIRPALLESMIVALKIDAVFASAAPPLGATTRILLALAMAGLGGLIGAALARRIARPKPVVVARRRGAGPVAESRPRQYQPVAAPEEETESAAEMPERPSNAPVRRSQLAMKEEPRAPREYAEHAPLPGGSPHILNVSEFNLEGFEASFASPAAPAAGPELSFEPETAAPVPNAPPEGVQVFVAEPVEPAPDAVLPQPQLPAAYDEDRQVFRAVPAVSEPAEAELPAAPPPFAEPAMSLPEPQPELAPAIDDAAPFGVPDEAAHPTPDEPHEIDQVESEQPAVDLPRLGSDAAAPARPRTIFDTEPAPGLFTRPLNARVAHVGWPTSVTGQAKPAAAPTEPQMPQPQDGEFAAQGHEPAAPEPASVSEAPSEPVSEAAAERIASADLGDLSHVELLERLAISMRRKSEASRAPAAKALEPAPAVESPAAPQQEQLPSEQPEIAPAEAAQVAAPAESEAPAPFAPPVPFIPEALRPVALSLDDVDDQAHHYVPPRHIGAPAASAAEPEIAPAEPVVAEPVAAEPSVAEPSAPAEPEAESDEDVEASGYSSLLELSRPASAGQRFVRIEEPIEPRSEIEPVVVFPGQENRTAAPFAKPEASASAAAEPKADAPADQPPPFAPPASRKDPAETERALRGALSTLQRMSGAV